MEGYSLNSIFPTYGNWKYKGETIEEVLQKDSGYIKDLIRLHPTFCLSEECMLEAQKITKGFYDKWTKPKQISQNIFESLRTYRSPYDFDFNDESIKELNSLKLATILNKNSILF